MPADATARIHGLVLPLLRRYFGPDSPGPCGAKKWRKDARKSSFGECPVLPFPWSARSSSFSKDDDEPFDCNCRDPIKEIKVSQGWGCLARRATKLKKWNVEKNREKCCCRLRKYIADSQLGSPTFMFKSAPFRRHQRSSSIVLVLYVKRTTKLLYQTASKLIGKVLLSALKLQVRNFLYHVEHSLKNQVKDRTDAVRWRK